ncbi:hypothetical protein ABHC40_06240 [Turicibacter sanguinis]|uniref:hypothetical protein n=1 Tax=Turicibacter sanguinis TaxID=154288 RepID=UPI00325ABB2E
MKTEISNAWKNSVLIDGKGWIWVKKEKLHSILRTTKDNINFIVMKMPDEYKRTYDGKLYIRGFKVMEQIIKSEEENGTGTKGINLKASKQYYEQIHMCDTVKMLRLDYDNQLKSDRSKLKKKRRSTYKITHDELTGEKLKTNYEFSHIRSYSMFREIANNIDNGLLVNKDIHRQITERGINNEDQLLKFCEEHGYKTDWYLPYKKLFP